MTSPKNMAALAGAGLLAAYGNASAHGVAGARIFPTTLTIDDPAVADEASLPTLTYNRQGAQGGPGAVHVYTVSGEYDKRITQRIGIAINYGGVIQDTANDKVRGGFQDLTVTLKYQAVIDAEHEFLLALGVIREFGRTGTAHLDADNYGSTTPTVYFGKGLGDLPIGWLRPLAITGTGGYTIADKKLKGTPAGSPDPDTGLSSMLFNTGYANRWVGGLSVQYSLPYLQSQVRDVGLGSFFGRITPIVEMAFSSPASKPSNLATQIVYAPGLLYSGDTYQVGLEALVPGNKASGTNVGFIAQFHVFLDDLFPTSLGRPIFQ